MNKLTPIQQATAALGVTSRTLRYWETEGLIESTRGTQSNCRAYDDGMIRRIRLVIVLRGLGVTVRDIRQIFDAGTISAARGALSTLLDRLSRVSLGVESRKKAISAILRYLSTVPETEMVERVFLPIQRPRMDDIVNEFLEAYEMCNRMKGIDYRLIVLPPMRTCAYSSVGVAPEDRAIEQVVGWIKKENLIGTMRLFGFNTEPYPSQERAEYGFGFCATIPEGVEISEPLWEFRLAGGAYAALDSSENIAEGWSLLKRLIQEDLHCEPDFAQRPCLEEHVRNTNPTGSGNEYGVTLLMPIREKQSSL